MPQRGEALMSWDRIYEDPREEIVSLIRAGMEDTGPHYESYGWEELINEYEVAIRADERARIAAWLYDQYYEGDPDARIDPVWAGRRVEENDLS